QRLERGRYLVNGVLSCWECHAEYDGKAPGVPPIAERLGSGLVLTDKPGKRLVAPNISPDIETRAGTWTDDMFARGIREGVGHDGRVLSDWMPYETYRILSDEDVASIVVYLRFLPSVRNVLPKTELSEEATQRLEAKLQPITTPVSEADLSEPV